MNLLTKQTTFTITLTESEITTIIGVMNKYNCAGTYRLNEYELPVRDMLYNILYGEVDE